MSKAVKLLYNACIWTMKIPLNMDNQCSPSLFEYQISWWKDMGGGSQKKYGLIIRLGTNPQLKTGKFNTFPKNV